MLLRMIVVVAVITLSLCQPAFGEEKGDVARVAIFPFEMSKADQYAYLGEA